MLPRPSTLPQWITGVLGVLVCAAWFAFVASCRPPTPRGPEAPQPGPDEAVALSKLVGSWEWKLETDQDGVHRIEHERWRFTLDPKAPAGALRAIGAYDRDVEFRSDDGVPFVCAQAPVYHQRARFQVTAEVGGDGATITETAYQVEPSPCDRGYRKLGSYRAAIDPRGAQLVLSWDGGSQALARVSDRPLAEVPPMPGLHPRWNGAWTWSAHTMDDAGDLRDEREDWQITVGDNGVASATYVRTVTTTSATGRPIICAGTRRWTYVDRYVLDGHLDGDLLTLTEVAGDPGTHPCLATTPERTLDSAVAERNGDYLELEWRGKRRQVLRRP
jgi:hypothetical protein